MVNRTKFLHPLIVLLCLIAIYWTLLSRFELHLLFTDTVLTGGDSASWLQPLMNLRTQYLPRFRLFGYSHSNFFGYLEGQQYFPLPFLTGALLSYLLRPTVALKLVTVAGAFALPATTFFAARRFFRSSFFGVAAAALSLLFLFNESYTMFGGNFLSTFAGEFSYSWAIALLPLFLVSVLEDHGRERWSPRSGLLLGTIGLCHMFVFMVAFFLPFFFALRELPSLFWRRGKAERGGAESDPGAAAIRVPLTYLVALCLMAFWLLPMLSTRTWAQSISMIWRFSGFTDFARQTLMPLWVCAFLSSTLLVLLPERVDKTASRAPGYRFPAAFLLYGLSSCAFLFFIATALEVPDIRFVPPVLILSIFAILLLVRPLASFAISRIFRSSGVPSILHAWGEVSFSILVVAIACPWATMLARNAPGWFRWNYTGYEAKAEWANLAALSSAYRGDIMDGRILWEKQDQADNVDFGSERGFENLYYFTGRPSTEGIHYGSSFMARAITYLQSSYSLHPVDPEADRLYSVVDPDSWALRFTQANARYIVVYSDEIKRQFSSRPEFRLDRSFGKFSVYEYLLFPGSYVEVRDPSSLSVVTDSSGGFKTDFYRFFRDYQLIGHPFVPASFADAALNGRVKTRYGSYDGLYDSYQDWAPAGLSELSMGEAAAWRAYPEASSREKVRNERLSDFVISFDTSSPGFPHIIKASYAPSWRSVGGETIYPISPGFMLIYPKGEHVILEYRRSVSEWAGLALTLLVLPALLLTGRRLAAMRTLHYRAAYVVAFLIFFAAIATLSVRSATGTAKMKADVEKARALDLRDAGQRARASALVSPYAKPRYLERYDNRIVFNAYRIKADIFRREGRIDEARAILTLLVERYSHTRDVKNLPRY